MLNDVLETAELYVLKVNNIQILLDSKANRLTENELTYAAMHCFFSLLYCKPSYFKLLYNIVNTWSVTVQRLHDNCVCDCV